jgi:hypothetical protein
VCYRSNNGGTFFKVESRAAALSAQNKGTVFWWIDPADRKKTWCEDTLLCWMDPSEGA